MIADTDRLMEALCLPEKGFGVFWKWLPEPVFCFPCSYCSYYTFSSRGSLRLKTSTPGEGNIGPCGLFRGKLPFTELFFGKGFLVLPNLSLKTLKIFLPAIKDSFSGH